MMGGAVGVMPDSPGASGISVGNADAAASPLFDRAKEVFREIAYCTPGQGATPSARFLTKFCYSIDDTGQLHPIPAWDYVLEDCATLELAIRTRQDIHDEKTRQMIATTMSSGQHLWRTMMTRNASGFITSRKERLVDDGGERSTPSSIMGRMRQMYENMPRELRDYAPVEFSKLRISCERTKSWVVGEGASGEAARGGTFDVGDADEAAFIEGTSWYRAMRAACRVIRQRSTPNGKNNVFARVKFETPGRYIFLRKHWTRHPGRKIGLYHDDNGRPRSPWYDEQTSSLLPDEIAREYDISYAHSVSGLVWPEWDEDNEQHLSWDIVYDPTLPLYVGMDFGVAAATVAIFFQVHGKEMWIIGDYESWEGDPDDHAPAIWAKAQALGFMGERKELRFYGDPAGDNREQSNKSSTVMRAYRAHGFTQFSKAPRHPVKDGVRMVRRKIKRGEVRMHMQCSHGRRRIPDYRYRTDVDGRVTGGEVIADTHAVHYGDAVRFGALGVYRIDEDYGMTVDQPRLESIDATMYVEPGVTPAPQYEPLVFIERGMGVGTIAPPMDTRY